MSQALEDTLFNKIRSLPEEQLATVHDFIDFLHQRERDRNLTLATSKLSEEAPCVRIVVAPK